MGGQFPAYILYKYSYEIMQKKTPIIKWLMQFNNRKGQDISKSLASQVRSIF